MINYEVLSESTKCYDSLGYNRIEAPWLITEQISDITKPVGAHDYKVDKPGTKKVFVASGEQSFLYLINKGFLSPGKYQTITPCMRYESFDETHTKYFMKNELIEFGIGVFFNDKKRLNEMIDNAKTFFLKYFNEENIQISLENDIYDINYVDDERTIELGSYGYRECLFTDWIFGTGVAEPRFSRIARKYGNGRISY